LSLETAAFTDGATKAQAQMRALSGSAQAMAGGFRSFGASASNMRVVGLELTHITRSLGEQLAMGVSPARAFASEIGRIGTAVQYAGGIGGLGRAVASLVAPFATVAAGAGILAAAFLGVKQQAEDDAGLQKYVQTLGLTEKQISKLKDVTVTWGDVAKATFEVVANASGTSSGQISSFFHSAFEQVGKFGEFAAEIILAAFAASVKGVISAFSNLPGIVGNAAVAAANAAVAAAEFLINAGIGGINRLIAGVNAALGTAMPTIATVSLGRIQASFHGSFANIGNDIKTQFFGTFGDISKGFDKIAAQAEQNARNRLSKQAADMLGDTAGGGRAARAHKAANDELKKQDDLWAKINQDLASNMAALVPISDELKKQGSLVEGNQAQTNAFLKGAVDSGEIAITQLADLFKARQDQLMHFADEFGGAIASVVTGTESLKDAFSNLARSIISELVQMTVKMLIFRALTSAFGNFFGSPSAGDAGAVSSFSGAGESVGVPGFASGGSGTFGGIGGVDQNILSLNGSPIARVSQGEQFSVSPSNDRGQAVNVTQYNNFAGGAATQDDVVKMGVVTKQATIAALRQEARRRS
jgi:hypothetical protein